MRRQTFANRVRYYAPHHFVFYPLLLAAIVLSVYACVNAAEQRRLWLAVIMLLLFIGWSSFMMRQHYALANQNRIIRMELRFRYYVLTGKRLELFEDDLNFSQMAALRFASDGELPALVDRTVKEKLSQAEIKTLIVQWLPDTMRV